jgi:hypothetical protein
MPPVKPQCRAKFIGVFTTKPGINTGFYRKVEMIRRFHRKVEEVKEVKEVGK